MQFLSTAAALATLSASALAAPAPAAAAAESATYSIQNFGERKLDGQTIDTIFFDIVATNGGTLDFECSPYNTTTQAPAEGFQFDTLYSCGKDTAFSFRFGGEPTTLTLYQQTAPFVGVTGSVEVPAPYCHAGGSNPNDQACFLPQNLTITLTQ